MERKHQFKAVSDVTLDEEHGLYSVSFTDAQGALRSIDWALASSPENRLLLHKQAELKDQLNGPFLIEYAAKGGVANAAQEDAEGAEEEEGQSAEAQAEMKQSKRPSRILREPVEKQTARELYMDIVETGKKDYSVQRYKGLGEMTSPQLWETTMDPERRTLLRVKLEDIAETETIFTTLMGEDVEARRKFIEDNALDVKNLDI